MRVRYLALVAAMVLAGYAVPAAAQMNNLPYQGSARSGGFGMSLGHRQAILDRELRGRSSNPLVRGANGQLLEVERRGSQAFVRSRSDAFFPAARLGARVSGLGWGGQAAGGSSYAARGLIAGGGSLYWIGMLAEPGGQLPWSGLTAGSTFATPIDTWIAQIGELSAF